MIYPVIPIACMIDSNINADRMHGRALRDSQFNVFLSALHAALMPDTRTGTLTDGISNDRIDVCTRTRKLWLPESCIFTELRSAGRFSSGRRIVHRSLIYRLYPCLIAFDNRRRVEHLRTSLQRSTTFPTGKISVQFERCRWFRFISL